MHRRLEAHLEPGGCERDEQLREGDLAARRFLLLLPLLLRLLRLLLGALETSDSSLNANKVWGQYALLRA